MHNVYFVQYIFRATEQVQPILKFLFWLSSYQKAVAKLVPVTKQ